MAIAPGVMHSIDPKTGFPVWDPVTGYGPMDVQAQAPAPAPAGYTGLGIFPWETPAGVGVRAPWTPIQTTPSGGQLQVAAGALPVAGAIVGGGALGAITGLLAGAYGISQAVGLQYPWETGPGEGFISPLTPQVRDEAGQWVTPQTRPGLFTPATAGRMSGMLTQGQAAGKAIGGDVIVSSWTTGPGGQTFYRLASGKIGTMTKMGMWKTWRPKKHIVLPRGNTTLSQAVKAQKFLDKMWRTVARKTKALKLA